MAKHYFELRSSSSSKFWEVCTRGKILTVRYGRIGSTGQTKVKELGSAAAAAKESDKLIASKRKKGYTLTEEDAKKSPKKSPKKKVRWPLNSVAMASVRRQVPKGRSLPPLLADFGKWLARRPCGALGYFDGIGSEPFHDGGLPDKANSVIADALAPFIALGEGSQVALWYHGKGAPAVVLVDSEGQHENIRRGTTPSAKSPSMSAIQPHCPANSHGRSGLRVWRRWDMDRSTKPPRRSP